MIGDFLKANPWCSLDKYMWELTVPQIRLWNMDYSHVEYLDSEVAERYGYGNDGIQINAKNFKNFTDLGMPIIQ